MEEIKSSFSKNKIRKISPLDNSAISLSIYLTQKIYKPSKASFWQSLPNRYLGGLSRGVSSSSAFSAWAYRPSATCISKLVHSGHFGFGKSLSARNPTTLKRSLNDSRHSLPQWNILTRKLTPPAVSTDYQLNNEHGNSLRFATIAVLNHWCWHIFTTTRRNDLVLQTSETNATQEHFKSVS